MSEEEDEGFRVGELLPGTEWLVKGVLGRGGMGVVLDCYRTPGIRSAIKVLLARHGSRDEFVERCMREVEVLASLDHPNIVRVQNWGLLPSGSPYLVMERLEGSTLRTVARRRAASGRPITAKQIYEIAKQICEGLRCAHTHEPAVVHRDLKPDNVFIHNPAFGDETVKLIDFGVAEWFRPAPASSRDSSRDVIGSPRYMSPESYRGDPVGPQADLYSVGLILYELITLRFPWNIDLRNLKQLKEAHTELPPIPASCIVSWVPKEVNECLLRALSKWPQERHDSIGAFLRALWGLQFADDGTLLPEDVNTTLPTLATLSQVSSVPQDVEAAGEAAAGEGTTHREGGAAKSSAGPGAGGQETKAEGFRREPSESDESPAAPRTGENVSEELVAHTTSSVVARMGAPSDPKGAFEMLSTGARVGRGSRRRTLIGSLAAGVGVVAIVGVALRAKPSPVGRGAAAAVSLEVVSGTASGIPREVVADMANSPTAPASRGSDEVQDAAPALPADLDGPRPNLGVAPLPLPPVVTEGVGARDGAPPIPSSAVPLGGRKMPAKLPRPPARGPKRDDGFDLLSGSP